MAREIKQWITINGVHVPIFEGQSKGQAVRGFLDKIQNKKLDKDTKFKDAKKDSVGKNESPAYNKNWSKDDAEKYIANQLAKGKDSDYVILAKNGHHTVVKDWKEAREAMKEDSGWKHVKEDSDKIMKMADNLKTKQNVDNNEKIKQEQIAKNEQQKKELNSSTGKVVDKAKIDRAKELAGLYPKMANDLRNREQVIRDIAAYYGVENEREVEEKYDRGGYSDKDIANAVSYAAGEGLPYRERITLQKELLQKKESSDVSKTGTSYGSGDDKFKQDLKNLTTENLRAVHDNHNKAFANVKTPEQKEWWDRTAKAIMDEEKRRTSKNNPAITGTGKAVDSERKGINETKQISSLKYSDIKKDMDAMKTGDKVEYIYEGEKYIYEKQSDGSFILRNGYDKNENSDYMADYMKENGGKYTVQPKVDLHEKHMKERDDYYRRRKSYREQKAKEAKVKSDVTDEKVKSAVQYYLENSAGFSGIRDFVKTEYPFASKEWQEKMIKEMKKKLG